MYAIVAACNRTPAEASRAMKPAGHTESEQKTESGENRGRRRPAPRSPRTAKYPLTSMPRSENSKNAVDVAGIQRFRWLREAPFFFIL